MKVKFKNGTVKECSAPVETKVFKNGAPAGWILMFNLVGAVTSSGIDEVLTTENIENLTFIPDGEGELGFELNGYNKISSSTIRYADEVDKTKVEIQLMRGATDNGTV